MSIDERRQRLAEIHELPATARLMAYVRLGLEEAEERGRVMGAFEAHRQRDYEDKERD